MKPCVLIPTYNESKRIGSLIYSIKKLGLEVLVVDDGSTDDTFDIAKRESTHALRNEKNEGKGVAIRKGFEYLLSKDYDIIIMMDGDGQHSPDDINNFLEELKKSDCDMIIGSRMDDLESMPKMRVFTNKFMSSILSRLSGQFISDTQCGFRLIKRKVIETIKLTTSNYEIESEMIVKASRAGFKIRSVAIKTIYTGQVSQINPLLDTFRFLRFIINILFKR